MKKAIVLSALMLSSFMTVKAQNLYQPTPSVNVSGEASVSIVPDYATITIGSEIKNAKADVSKKESDAIISKAISVLKKHGIKDKDIQTQRVNLYNQQDYEKKTSTFVSSQTLVFSLYQLDHYEKIMSDLIASGVNVINGVEFKSTKTADYQTEIRQKAILDAKKKATDYATALNQNIGKALAITDQNSNVAYPQMYAMKAADANMETTMAEGEIKITTNVQVSFELK